MQNRYYQLSKKKKRNFYINLTIIIAVILITLFLISFYLNSYFLALFGFWILLSITAPFLDIPSMIQNGKLQYESSLLISEKEKNNQITIHGGSLFDYYFVLNKQDKGSKRRNLILLEYLNGILQLIKSNKENPNLEILGTTYILNQRTANKIGFKIQKTNPTQLIILIINYPNLVFTKSFAHKNISFPNLKNIKTYKSSIKELAENKKRITKIRNTLQSNIVNNESSQITELTKKCNLRN